MGLSINKIVGLFSVFSLLVCFGLVMTAPVMQPVPFEDQIRFDHDASKTKFCRLYPWEDPVQCVDSIEVSGGIDALFKKNGITMSECELGFCRGQKKIGCTLKGHYNLACRLFGQDPDFNETVSNCNAETFDNVETTLDARKYKAYVHPESGTKVMAFRFCLINVSKKKTKI